MPASLRFLLLISFVSQKVIGLWSMVTRARAMSWKQCWFTARSSS